MNLDKILKSLSTYNRTVVHFKDYKDNKLEKTIDHRILLPLCKNTAEKREPVKPSLEVGNQGRTFVTMPSNEALKAHGKDALSEDNIQIKTIGNIGSSFGAFLPKDIRLEIMGDSNDYLGRGLSGGKITAKISNETTFSPEENIIVGNTCLYRATEDEAYLDGIVGKRSYVRSSGAKAVVLGTDVHGCEYMAGGLVIVLGNVGASFAAGMSGGVIYILGRHNEARANTELMDIKGLSTKDERGLKMMIEDHVAYTNSKKAKDILEEFDKKDFFKIIPRDYEKMLEMIELCKDEKDPDLAAFLKIIQK